MQALLWLVVRVLLPLASIPAATLMTQMIFHPQGDDALGTAPFLLLAFGAFLLLAIVANRYVIPRPKEPVWLKSRLIRVSIRLVIVFAVLMWAFAANPSF